MLGKPPPQTPYRWNSQEDVPKCTGMNDKDGAFHASPQEITTRNSY